MKPVKFGHTLLYGTTKLEQVTLQRKVKFGPELLWGTVKLAVHIRGTMTLFWTNTLMGDTETAGNMGDTETAGNTVMGDT